MANTSTTLIAQSSIIQPNIRPMTQRGTPARQCFSIFKRANDEMYICQEVSGFGTLQDCCWPMPPILPKPPRPPILNPGIISAFGFQKIFKFRITSLHFIISMKILFSLFIKIPITQTKIKLVTYLKFYQLLMFIKIISNQRAIQFLVSLSQLKRCYYPQNCYWKMLPIYKVFSLLVRVFSRPMINYTKKIHANNPKRSYKMRQFFIWFGNFYHRYEAKLNRKVLKVQSQFAFKPLNDELAMQKGIEFFYEILFYTLVIGIPLYEMNRHSNEALEKESNLGSRLKNIETKIQKILHEVQTVNNLEKIAAFMIQNRGKYCYPNLKIHLQGVQVDNNQFPVSVTEYRMCLL